MARTFSQDEVLRLAPDAGSAKSGQELAQWRKWVMLEGDDAAIWGACQGSGSKPYQVQIDLAEPAFKCSCPSRKFPCKHALGLLLIHATTPAAIVKAERPAWVSEWLASREARAAKAVEKQTSMPAPSDPEAQAKRRGKRIKSARAGLGELSVWMRDLVRAGMSTVPSKGFEFFDNQARRMVDAQIPGAARWVRNLGSLAARGAGWQRPFFEQLSLLHLLVRAVERFDELPEAVRADVQSTLGITTAADELSDLPATADSWQVIAQEVELEDKLRVRRTWLCGTRSQRAAMVLHFAHGTAGFEANLPPGMQMEAELVFFPGNGPRAVVRDGQFAEAPLTSFDGCESAGTFLDRYSRAIAECPWHERLCWPLCRVTPSRAGERWWAIDSSGSALPIRARDEVGFALLAVSGGEPVDIAAEYDGEAVRPLAAVAEGRWLSLAPTFAGAN